MNSHTNNWGKVFYISPIFRLSVIIKAKHVLLLGMKGPMIFGTYQSNNLYHKTYIYEACVQVQVWVPKKVGTDTTGYTHKNTCFYNFED